MRTLLIALSVLVLLAACGVEEPQKESKYRILPPLTTPPDRVTVDHILIAVKNPRIPNGKTPEEAKALAYDLLKQIEAGGDWAALKKQYSDDPPPGGPYTMFNDAAGVQGSPGSGEFPRSGMAKAFGDVSFTLPVGAMGMADHDPQKSPFGYHIIGRDK